MDKFNEELCLKQTYEVLIGKETIQTLIKTQGEVHLLYDPGVPVYLIDSSVFEILIDHYVQTEQYEK